MVKSRTWYSRWSGFWFLTSFLLLIGYLWISTGVGSTASRFTTASLRKNIFFRLSNTAAVAPPAEIIFYTDASKYLSLKVSDLEVLHTPSCNRPYVLIATPLKDAEEYMSQYVSQLLDDPYPKSCLSIGFLVSDSKFDVDPLLQNIFSEMGAPASFTRSGTAAAALNASKALLRAGYRRVTLVTHDFHYSLALEHRHDYDAQPARRRVLAQSRNHLVHVALKDEDFVLWLDSDVLIPPGQDPLNKLVTLSTTGKTPSGEVALQVGGKPVIPSILTADCRVPASQGNRSYDLNTWKMKKSPGSNASPKEVINFFNYEQSKGVASRHYNEGSLWFQGYLSIISPYLHDGFYYGAHLRDRGMLTRVDAVGGTFLLVRAKLHRLGLMFPVSSVRHTIETEGLALSALDFGVLSWFTSVMYTVHH